jgi:hypothetical protein
VTRDDPTAVAWARRAEQSLVAHHNPGGERPFDIAADIGASPSATLRALDWLVKAGRVDQLPPAVPGGQFTYRLADVWYPPPRYTRKGHRATVGGRTPVGSRYRRPWWTMLFEHINRLEARLMRGQPPAARDGLEPAPAPAGLTYAQEQAAGQLTAALAEAVAVARVAGLGEAEIRLLLEGLPDGPA